MEGVYTAEAVIDNGAFGTHTIRFETGRLARLAAGSAVAYLDEETVVLSATTAGKHPKEGLDFFPLTVDVRRADVCGGPDSRLVLPPRGPPVRGRDPHLPADRPAAPPFVRQGSAQRSSGCRDDPRAQSRAPVRRGRHQRRVPVHHARRAAVLGSDRGRAGRPDQGPVGRVPHPRAAERGHLRHGGRGPDAAGRRRGHHDGRGRVHHRHARPAGRLGQRRGRAHRGHRAGGPGGGQAVPQAALRGAAAGRRPGRQADRPSSPCSRTTSRTSTTRWPRRSPASWPGC